MNIAAAFEEAKSLPDEALAREVQSPTGMIPGYIALGELQERAKVRGTNKPTQMPQYARKYSEGGILAELNPFIAYIESLQNPEMAGQIQQEKINEAFNNQPPLSLFQLQTPQAATSPMSIEDMKAPPPGVPKKPRGFAKGGMLYLDPYQRALLNTIAGPESAGRYNVIYGGRRFSDYSRHPGINVPIQSGPNVGKTSSAAGKYQFIRPTWEAYQKRMGLPDFSPASQDAAAWQLAADRYKAITGNDLHATLMSGDPNRIAGVGSALRHTWTSLPGGIEQGTNTSRFVNTYNKYLSNPRTNVAAQAANTAKQTVAQQALASTQAANAAVAQSAATNAAMQAMPKMPLPMAAAAPTGMNIPAQAAAPNPMGGLMSLLMQQKMAQKSAPAPMPAASAPVQQDIDPMMETIKTSHTPNVYMKRKRGIL